MDVVYLDVCKAFDRVLYDIFLSVLDTVCSHSPGNIQDEVGLGSEQRDMVKGVPTTAGSLD